MDPSRDLSRTANASSKLIETVEKFTELEESGFDDEHSAYHAVVSLVHQLCMNIGHAEKLGHNRTDIERILEPVWELHSRSPFFRRMQSWPRGYPGDYETIEYLCECVSKARPGTVEYFIDQYGVTCNMAQQHRNKLTWQAAKVLQTSLGSAEESHVLSIACGGSRDLRTIQSLLQAAPVQLFLNDIDADALAHSVNTLPHLDGRLYPIHANVFSAVRTFKKRGPFDLIVTGGLFDYLSDKQITWLLEKLFESLKTEGRLCFTNIARGNPYRVWMEYLGDWKLLERSEADITTLIRETDLETSTQLDISRDQTGLTHLVELTRIV